MKHIRNLSILSQLKFVYYFFVIVVMLFALNSFWQSQKLHEQTVLLEEHPLQVRAALAEIRMELLQLSVLYKDANPERNNDKINAHLLNCELQFDVLNKKYLGPEIDRKNAWNHFQLLKSNILHYKPLNDKMDEYHSRVILELKVMDDFAKRKSQNISKESNRVFESLNRQNILLMVLVLLILGFTGKYLYHQLKDPLFEINSGIENFRKGELSQRVSVRTKNEFGFLSNNLNSLFDWIEEKSDITDQELRLNNLMIEETSLSIFLAKILNTLRVATSAQIGAIYLKDDNKVKYKPTVSIGIDWAKIPSYSVEHPEGEAGIMFAERKVIKISGTDAYEHLKFTSLSGEISPKEILLIPFFNGNEMLGFLSLASVNSINKNVIQFLEKVHPSIQSKLVALLAENQLHTMYEKLELQNNELRVQRNELSRQSEEVSEQNRELEMQKNQLTETNRFKTSFLSNMSHELRTPLNSVIALSGVLNRKLEGKIPEDEYNYIDVIERNGKHLLNLINDILDISRIEAGKEEVCMEQFSIERLLQQLQDLTGQQAKQKGLDFQIINENKNLQLLSDYRKCLQVLTNLVANAIKFTEEGKITLKIELKDSYVAISVIDTGIGIHHEQIEHIFDEFKQADESTSRRFGGTGLGLTIARKYANLLGGNVTATSKPGMGSEFQFILPNTVVFGTDEPIVPVLLKEELKPNKLAFLNKTILLVDDSEPALIQLTFLCKQLGLHVLTANNAQEALKIIQVQVPDAIVLDLMMPNISGFELLDKIRSAEPTAEIPVLVLTAKEITSEELKLLKRNNVHQLIQKGDIQASELQWKLTKLIGQEQGLPKVLHVEDNEDNRLTIQALLKGMYTVKEANDGQMGIHLAKSWKPELILMDIALPLLNGIDAMKEIRKDPDLEFVPIIAISAFASNYDKNNLLEMGFNGYITKPVDPTQLLKIMKEVLYGK